jgi:hypothetical protein
MRDSTKLSQSDIQRKPAQMNKSSKQPKPNSDKNKLKRNKIKIFSCFTE